MVKEKTLIDVWRPRITLPTEFIEQAAGATAYLDELTPVRICGQEAICSEPKHPWHEDVGFGDWSLIYVIRNDAGSYVEGEGTPAQKNQPAGTAIILEISKFHRLACTTRKKGCWVGLMWDFDQEKQPTRSECNEKIRKKLAQGKRYMNR